jgi:drug/metabolite transporter (DMT)-like permease
MKPYSSSNWLTLIVLSIIWGCSFLFMKKGLDTFRWDIVAAMRISISCVAIIPVLILHFKKINPKELKYYAITGFFGSGLPAFCFTFAQTHIESGISGVLNSMTPVFVFVLGVLFFGMKFEKWKLFGLIVSLTGAVLLVIFDETESGQSNILFALPVFLATVSYAISANTVKRYLQDAHPLAMGAAGFMMIGIPAIIYLFTTKFWELSGEQYFLTSVSSIAALAILGTVTASIVFYALIQKTDSVFGSLVAYLIPIVAIILGIIDGEQFMIHHFAGMILILAGIYLLNYFPKNKPGEV